MINEELYFALNKLNELKTENNKNEIEEIQGAILYHLELEEKAFESTKKILDEMDKIAEKGLAVGH